MYSIIKCDKQINVDFDVDAIYDHLRPKYKKLLSEVHNNYWKSYLVIDAIGKFEMNGQGYGHLGHNQAVFTPERIINMELVEKKKTK
jgi:hypothetical protein